MVLLVGWQLQWCVQGQVSFDVFVFGEQFGLGGVNVVCGYGECEVFGDQGLFGFLELLMCDFLFLVGGVLSFLCGLFFVDVGKVWNYSGMLCCNGEVQCVLVLVGLGV